MKVVQWLLGVSIKPALAWSNPTQPGPALKFKVPRAVPGKPLRLTTLPPHTPPSPVGDRLPATLSCLTLPARAQTTTISALTAGRSRSSSPSGAFIPTYWEAPAGFVEKAGS
ncbi:hypothetical protein NL676_025396 [Syzygium grande]|nr:hypothetical protein NL676_025396 [Syzygium grande]